MPVLIAFVINALRIMLLARVGMMIARVVAWLGINFAVNKYTIQPAMDFIRDLMASGPGGDLGPKVMAWAGVMRLDTATSMLLSAYAAVWTIKSLKVFFTKSE